MKSHPQKNTLLKNAQANAKGNFFKRVFFSPTQEEFFPPLFFLFFFRYRTGSVLNLTDIASNVNLFGQSACKLDTTPLRTDRRASGNRVARPTQNYVGRGSHTTVHADLAYGGSWCKRVAHECLFRANFLVVIEHGFVTALS